MAPTRKTKVHKIMKIQIQKVSYEDIYLSDSNVKEVTSNKLKSMLGKGEWLRTRDGKQIVTKDEDNWRHGSVYEDYVRDATELDLAIFTVLKAINGN